METNLGELASLLVEGAHHEGAKNALQEAMDKIYTYRFDERLSEDKKGMATHIWVDLQRLYFIERWHLGEVDTHPDENPDFMRY